MKQYLRTGLAAAGAVAAAVGWYAWRIETRWLDVNHFTLALPDLPSAFAGYRIVHIGDMHLSARIIRDHLPYIVQAVNREHPDLIVNTGDYVTAHQDSFEDLHPALAQLHAPDGVWSILGNHDLAAGADSILHILHAAGIKTLRNEHHILRRGDDTLTLAGVDDVVRGFPNLSVALNGVAAHDRVILLAHEPDFARIAAADPRIVLQLSGHAHGGQVRLPGLQPLYLPDFGKFYPVGMYRVGEMALYVTRGIGVSLLHMRFNCRPEIAVITLACATIGQEELENEGKACLT